MNIQNALPDFQVMKANHLFVILKEHISHKKLRVFCKALEFVASCDGWGVDCLFSNPLIASSRLPIGYQCSKKNVIAWLLERGDEVIAVRCAPIEPPDGKWRFTLTYQNGDLVCSKEMERAF